MFDDARDSFATGPFFAPLVDRGRALRKLNAWRDHMTKRETGERRLRSWRGA
jgi:hypothetical protein